MSEKWTGRIAIFCILSILGILILAALPDSMKPDNKKTEHVIQISQENEISEGESGSAQMQTSIQDEVSTQPESSEGQPEEFVVQMPDSVTQTPDSAAQTPDSTALAQEQSTGLYSYYYNSLDAVQREIYNQVYQSVMSRESVVLDTLDDSIVDKAFQCVMNDHPEIYYCSAYKLEKMMHGTELVKLTFMPQYHMTPEEQEAYKSQIDVYVQQCLNGVPQGVDEYTQVKYVYEYIIQNTEYVPNSKNNQNICSVFVGGQSVCQGYAKAVQYILTRAGIECTLAYGKVKQEFHSWNLVCVDGEYYYMDPTWGDAGYVRPQQSQQSVPASSVNYEYFLVTSQQIMRTHTIDNVVPLPACIATRNNYYVREGLYFTIYDQEMLKEVFERSRENGLGYVTFMCADQSLYVQMRDDLITGQKIFDYMSSAGSVSYSYNDDMYTLIFWIE